MASTAAVAVSQERRDELARNLADISGRVAVACTARPASIPAHAVRLVAVSKTKPAADIAALYDLGHRDFGENYIQELVEKSQTLPDDIRWRFIGTLQSNKCKLLASVKNLAAVETIDSARKATAMDKAVEGRSTPLDVFVQINTSSEESKSGVRPDECVSVARSIIETCPNLRLKGLMTIGAPDNIQNGRNPDFECLVSCKRQIEQDLPDAFSNELLELSMGMSDDFEIAIAHGATSVRVGSSIFGARNYPNKSTQ